MVKINIYQEEISSWSDIPVVILSDMFLATEATTQWESVCGMCYACVCVLAGEGSWVFASRALVVL